MSFDAFGAKETKHCWQCQCASCESPSKCCSWKGPLKKKKKIIVVHILSQQSLFSTTCVNFCKVKNEVCDQYAKISIHYGNFGSFCAHMNCNEDNIILSIVFTCSFLNQYYMLPIFAASCMNTFVWQLYLPVWDICNHGNQENTNSLQDLGQQVYSKIVDLDMFLQYSYTTPWLTTHIISWSFF